MENCSGEVGVLMDSSKIWLVCALHIFLSMALLLQPLQLGQYKDSHEKKNYPNASSLMPLEFLALRIHVLQRTVADSGKVYLQSNFLFE